MKYAYSMETVDVYRMAPNRNRYESKYFWEEMFRLVPTGGFEAIELPFEFIGYCPARAGIPFSKKGIDLKYGSADKFLKYLKSCGIKKVTGINYTVPGPIFEIASYPSTLEDFFAFFEMCVGKAVEFATEVKADHINITASPALGTYDGNIPDTYVYGDMLVAMLGRLADKAAAGGVRLCIRNEFWTVMRGMNILNVVDKLPENVYVCIDTANLAIAGVSPVSIIERCHGRIGSVIFTDTSFVDDGNYYLQKLPEFPDGKATQIFRDFGEGDIDFCEVKRALEAAGYDGYVVIDNRQTRDIFRGILRAKYCVENIIEK